MTRKRNSFLWRTKSTDLFGCNQVSFKISITTYLCSIPVKRSGWDLDNASVLSVEVVMAFLVIIFWFWSWAKLFGPVPTRLNLAGLFMVWIAAFLAAKLDLRAAKSWSALLRSVLVLAGLKFNLLIILCGELEH